MEITKSRINFFWKPFLIILTLNVLHVFFTLRKTNENSTVYSFLDRAWGFNHIKFYDTLYILAFYLIVFLVAIPAINQKIFEGINVFSDKLKKIYKVKFFAFALLAVITSIVFYAFKTKYFLLGDYTLRLTQTMKQEFLTNEYVTMKLLFHIATFLGKYSITPTQAFILVSCISGGVYVFINCLISDKLGKSTTQKVVLLIGGTVSGMLLFFCGYLDIYALPIVFTALYIYFSILYAGNKKYFWAAVAFLILSVSSHLLCISFAPALFIVWYYHNTKKVPFIAGLKNKTKLYAILALVFIAVAMVYKMKLGFVLPIKAPVTNPKYLTLLSFTHIWEVVNGELLGSGISFLFLMFLIYKVIKDKVVLSIQTYFFITATAGMMLTVFLANIHRGSGDWDILAFPAITLNFLVILLLFEINKKNLQLSNYLIVIVLIYNFLNAALWIHINSSQKSLAKVENMFHNDQGPYYTSKLPSILQLIYIYKENKLTEEAERLSQKACNTLPSNDFRGCMMFADLLVTQNKTEKAVAFYEELLQRNKFIPTAYTYLINAYQAKKDNQKLLTLIAEFYNAFKAQPNTFLQYIDVRECTSIIEYYYNYLKQTNPAFNFNEITSILNQLKQLQSQQKPRK